MITFALNCTIIWGVSCASTVPNLWRWGGTADHVHVLVAQSRTCSAADAVKELKRGSTLWLKAKAPDLAGFNWQSGYGVFSLGFSQIAPAMKYVARQAEHYQKISFKDEFLGLLRRYEIAADERYLWD